MKEKRNVLLDEYEAVKAERDKAQSELIAIEAETLASKNKHRKCNII
jgi:hypothetical protein